MPGTCTGDIDPCYHPYLMQYTEDFNTPEDISRVLNRIRAHGSFWSVKRCVCIVAMEAGDHDATLI